MKLRDFYPDGKRATSDNVYVLGYWEGRTSAVCRHSPRRTWALAVSEPDCDDYIAPTSWSSSAGRHRFNRRISTVNLIDLDAEV